MKKCFKCKILKDEQEFYSCKGVLQSNCKECHRRYVKEYGKSNRGKAVITKIRNSEKYWSNPSNKYNRAKASIKKKGGLLLLTKNEYLLIIGKPCHYCGDLLNNEKNRGIRLDRIDNTKTYVLDNVLSCCGFCNKTRGDRLTVCEMEKVAQFLIELRK